MSTTTFSADALAMPARCQALPGNALPRGSASFLVLLALTGALFFPFLNQRDLSSSHEARAAINATVVLERGCWGLPRLFDEQIELQKPPLYYWLVSVLGWLRGGGVDAWAVRLPAALAGMACVAWLWLLLHRRGLSAAGFGAGCVLATCVHFTWLAQVGRIDMPLTLTVAVALGCFFLSNNSWRWHLMGYVAVGLGLLLKGPIALVLTAVAALAVVGMDAARGGASAFLRNAAKRMRALDVEWGALVVAAVAGPWFVWANLETGGRLWDVFVWRHNFERGFGSESLAAHPWWFYLARFWIDLAPWSFVAPLAMAWGWRRGLWRDDAVFRLGLVWFVSMLLLLSCMRFKRADYLLPAYPGFALFLGTTLQHWQRACAACWRRGLAVAWLALLGTYVIGWATFHVALAEGFPYADAAARIRAHAGADTPVVFFRAESHPLAFHLGRPMTSTLEWENLAVWANEPRSIYFVMPAECADVWQVELPTGALERVFALDELHETRAARAFVVLRNVRLNP
jgi:4-amino-4-deoxy-L-arabinose transferase-like glycosyltransferase